MDTLRELLVATHMIIEWRVGLIFRNNDLAQIVVDYSCPDLAIMDLVMNRMVKINVHQNKDMFVRTISFMPHYRMSNQLIKVYMEYGLPGFDSVYVISDEWLPEKVWNFLMSDLCLSMHSTFKMNVCTFIADHQYVMCEEITALLPAMRDQLFNIPLKKRKISQLV